ncbi:hypothetical protein BOQ63_015965 [Streptomyces viridifaciens]|nr:hypothetical protein BOQ63_015965 [Streptomyces viridifaciens]
MSWGALLSDYRVSTNQLVLTSRGYSQLRHRVEEIATGLMGDLSMAAGMAGNDAGGRAFAAAYEAAAAETFDKIAFAAFVMAESATNLMKTAFNYLAAEDQHSPIISPRSRPRSERTPAGPPPVGEGLRAHVPQGRIRPGRPSPGPRSRC